MAFAEKKIMKHCCKEMRRAVAYRCKQHPNRYDCPDCLIGYIPKFNEYGILVHDGGTTSCSISHCPWCGTVLPRSRRDEWFDTLAKMGFDDLGEQNIPKAFLTDKWYKKKTANNRPNRTVAPRKRGSTSG
jgi:hypothetical protein